MSDAIAVELGPRRYDIIVGDRMLDVAGPHLRPHIRSDRVFIVTDENVFRAQGARLMAALARESIRAETIVLPPGETTKCFARLAELTQRLAEMGAERSDLVVAFGGGVIGDLAGLAAAVYKRGVRYAQIPTTLIAQVDSAVGGKTAIDIPQGKNLVGAFHQPVLVLADVSALATLPERELRAGYAEIVKYAAIGDVRFFAWLEANGAALLAGDRAARTAAVRRCCAMKAAIVAEDERDEGRRALLNFGHTFGHALEAAGGYALLHGEAVAAGMGAAADYSVARGLCPPADTERLKAHLRNAGLPTGLAESGLPAPPQQLFEFMLRDKKAADGALRLVLLRRLGDAILVKEDSEAELRAFLDRIEHQQPRKP
jgi:3-dehydroquinate synthase